jgi:hypothetical protein
MIGTESNEVAKQKYSSVIVIMEYIALSALSHDLSLMKSRDIEYRAYVMSFPDWYLESFG